MKKSNISLFIPHVGCPNRCSFCNQNEITGVDEIPNCDDVKRAIEESVNKSGRGVCELAFFGGSFTAIDRDYMLRLLKSAKPYVDSKDIIGIRCSTRPDAIDEEILDILKEYSVTSIELGAQSMDDEVLRANRRGHTAEDVINSSELIKEYGFELGLQMMTDLYMSTEKKDIKTAEDIISINPKTVRIYPTVILKGTELEKLYLAGKYLPMTIKEKARVAAKLSLMFKENNIDVIRVGLHSSKSIKDNAIADTFHDAFGEMVSSEILYNKITENVSPGTYDALINERSISKLIGQRHENMEKLQSLGYNLNIRIDNTLDIDDIKLNLKIS